MYAFFFICFHLAGRHQKKKGSELFHVFFFLLLCIRLKRPGPVLAPWTYTWQTQSSSPLRSRAFTAVETRSATAEGQPTPTPGCTLGASSSSVPQSGAHPPTEAGGRAGGTVPLRRGAGGTSTAAKTGRTAGPALPAETTARGGTERTVLPGGGGGETGPLLA